MSTLKELFDKHGSVWLADKDKPNEKELFMHGRSINDPFKIVLEALDGAIFYMDSLYKKNNYILYEEPKPKVKRYQYMIIPEKSAPFISYKLFKDENELLDYYCEMPFCKIKEYKRLDSTMREFDW